MKIYNHGLAEKQFEKAWNRQREEYREAGMSEEMILQMYEYEREVFNSDRRYLEHYMEAEFIWETSTDNASENARRAKKREKYMDAISVFIPDSINDSPLGWLEEIENSELCNVLSLLDKEDIELLTLYAFEELKITEIAKSTGVTKQTVWKKLERIKKIFKKFLNEG